MTDHSDLASQADALIQASQAASARGDTAEATRLLEQAAAVGGGHPVGLWLLGAEYAEARRYEEAEQCMTRAIELAPNMGVCRFQLGLMQLTSGRPQQAAQTWTPFDELPEEEPLRLFAVGLLAMVRGEYDLATAALQRGIALNATVLPLNRDMQMVLGEIDRLRNEVPPADGQATTEGNAQTEEAEETDSDAHVLLTAYRGSQLQ
ncbi:tetratricopeptide repeat protein [Parachitinimonas caeni]|uniref:Tetratricopeptide repeat protein n=1 Tax=Parachitinimonas caeni TaxID=3031301 RepID=A0ABT7E0Q0_9NEIS|nr:tetratricopeptide repeat protein [Parachitinimonas caeni]MDK2125893.1 tetratricopeptide repeat protein [Parachitinimonas caeni]